MVNKLFIYIWPLEFLDSVFSIFINNIQSTNKSEINLIFHTFNAVTFFKIIRKYLVTALKSFSINNQFNYETLWNLPRP